MKFSDDQFASLDYVVVYTQKISSILLILIDRDGMSFDKAITEFYKSRVYWALQYEESKFWGYSPERLVDLFYYEQQNGILEPLDWSK
ncbi:MAG: hypothetical protein MJZ33_04935 [Paludibacteraceae bacterium]|nr:hypothetical protein [Paludibacteraceae bacterium]